MFLHLGADVVVPLKDVVAILDYETSNHSEITSEFLRVADEEGFTKDISEGLVKSYIITNRNIYLSPISSTTLTKRAMNIYGITEESN